MLKKLRRFIIKRTLEKELITWLKHLNLLDENEIAKLVVDSETDFSISFDLNTTKNLFEKVYFYDSNSNMTVTVVLKNTTKNNETIKFSVTNFLDLFPENYTIIPKYQNTYNCIQRLDFDTGKITFKMRIDEDNNPEGLAVSLLGIMEDTAIKLFKCDILDLTINVDYFGEKTYWINAILSQPIYRPESTVKFKELYPR